ncbi:MAG: hypothetical protein K0S37_371 [Microbacterium sp.]|nr:hypothetical protein [Microbacterium sp.]
MSRPRPHHPAPTRRRRLRVVLAGSVAAAALIAGVSTVAAALAPTGDRVVATIDGADVTRAELEFHMQRVRATVQNGSGTSGPASRGTAVTDAALRDVALGEIERDRALLALAREHGLTDLRSFADLEAAREATNARRADQVANGEIVYGLTSFTLDEFRSRTLTGLRTDLIDALSTADGGTAELAVTDDEVDAYFAAHAEEWAAAATTYRSTRLEIPAEAGLDEAQVAELAASAASLEQAAAAVPGASASPVVIDAEGRSGDLALSPDVIAQLRELAPGATTTPQTHRGGWAVYRLDEASVDEQAALATYATRIRAVLTEARFDELLDARVAAQRTELLSTDWNAVKMEGTTR